MSSRFPNCTWDSSPYLLFIEWQYCICTFMFCLSDVKVNELKYVIIQNLLVVFRPNGTVAPHA